MNETTIFTKLLDYGAFATLAGIIIWTMHKMINMLLAKKVEEQDKRMDKQDGRLDDQGEKIEHLTDAINSLIELSKHSQKESERQAESTRQLIEKTCGMIETMAHSVELHLELTKVVMADNKGLRELVTTGKDRRFTGDGVVIPMSDARSNA